MHIDKLLTPRILPQILFMKVTRQAQSPLNCWTFSRARSRSAEGCPIALRMPGLEKAVRVDGMMAPGPKSAPCDRDLLRLPPHFPGGLIGSQTEECGVPQTVLGRPFHESDLRYELRLRPVHLAHLISGDSAAPSPDIRVRKIGKWTALDLQRLQLAEKLATNMWDETRAHLSGEA